MVVYLRMFEIEPALEEEFVRVYGPRGEWTQLFSRSPGYINIFSGGNDEVEHRSDS